MKNITAAIRDRLRLGNHYDNELAKVILYKFIPDFYRVHWMYFMGLHRDDIKIQFNKDVNGYNNSPYAMFNEESGYIG